MERGTYKKGDKEVPGNYRGIILLSVVGKRLVERLDKGIRGRLAVT